MTPTLLRPFVFLIVFLGQVLAVRAQTTRVIAPQPIQLAGCGTEPMDSVAAYYQPYFGNNQYLLDLVSEVEGNGCQTCRTFTGGIAPELYKIPVRVWVYQNDQGVGGPTNAQAEELINLMNERLRNTNVSLRLYLKTNITRVRNTGYFEGIDGKNTGFGVNHGSTNMMEESFDPNTINIHIIRVSRDGFSGRARRPDDTAPYSFAITTADFGSFQQMANVMVHELGHCFDLSHTHDAARNSLAGNNARASACYQEAVSRSRRQGFGCFGTNNELKCEVNGDLLCDTGADPQMSDNSVSLAPGCGYTGGGSDRWGDAWNPPTRNLMSYSRVGCISQFTPMQRGVIYHYIREYKTKWRLMPNGGGFVLIPPERRNNPTTFYTNNAVDRYENDNYFQQASTILYDESQLHAFHAQPNSTDADIDWVRFVATSSNPAVIRTSAVGTTAQPNTRLTLFAGDGVTVLATNDDLSSSSAFSRITTPALTPGATYFVRAENLSASGSPGFTGQYYFSLFTCFDQTDAEVQGASTLCLNSGNNTFSVAGLPAGSTVAWTVTPANSGVVSLSNTTGPTTLVSALNQGSVTLTATVTSGGCTVALTPKPVSVTGGFISLQRSPNENVCISSTVTVQATSYAGAVVTDWRVENGQLLYVNGNEASIQVSSTPGYTTVHADYDSTCPSGGSFTATTGFDVVGSIDGYYCAMMRTGDPQAAAYPNPTNTYLDIRSPFAAARPYRIELANDRGVRVYTETARSSAMRVNTQSFPTGLYHLTLRQGNQTRTYNLSIQH